MQEKAGVFRISQPYYPPDLTDPMREEMIRMGAEELRTPEEVDRALGDPKGTVLVVVNSVCGCAAGQCRPGVALALKNSVRPSRVVTAFAGVDRDATARARAYFAGYSPSSPQVALIKDGKVVFMLERHDIESRSSEAVAERLRAAFDQHCADSVGFNVE